MKHSFVSLLVLLTAALAASCGGTDTHRPINSAEQTATTSSTPAPTASATASPTIATPTASPTPVAPRLGIWNVAPKSGIAHIDTIVAALTAGDANANAVAPYLTGQLKPCHTPSSASANEAPTCRFDMPLGTPVPVLIAGACPADTTWVNVIESRPAPDTRHSYITGTEWAEQVLSRGSMYRVGVYRTQTNPPSYTLILTTQRSGIFNSGWAFEVDDRGVIQSIAIGAPRCLQFFGGDGTPIVWPP